MSTRAHEPAGRAQVLVVQHEPGAPAGWFGEALTEHGCSLSVATPYEGDVLPALEGFDALLVLGGAVDSWDEEAAPWLPATRELVRSAEVAGVPTLGICLGHQIAAHALGGRAGRNPAGRTVAVAAVGWLDDAGDDPLFGSSVSAGAAVHWNSDVVVELPATARVLARSVDGAVQAARLGGSVWGVQSHPEVDVDIVQTWLEEDWAHADDDQRREMGDLVELVRSRQELLIDSWAPLASRFAALAGRRAESLR